jgi:hypothetical protein
VYCWGCVKWCWFMYREYVAGSVMNVGLKRVCDRRFMSSGCLCRNCLYVLCCKSAPRMCDSAYTFYSTSVGD